VNELTRFSEARKALALASTMDEVKEMRDRAEMLRAYAKQAGESLEMQNMCAEIKLRAERRAGELLKELEKNKGAMGSGSNQYQVRSHDDTAPKLEAIGINKSQSSRWQAIAEVPEPKFESYIEVKKALEEEITTAGMLRIVHVSHNSGNNEWYTPKEYIKAARRVLGSIDLDPASSESANEVVGAEAIYTIEDDGLQQEWHGNVWLNPPYASDLVQKFADKLAAELFSGNVEEAIVLVNNATETKWFRKLVDSASAICFPTGRVRFWGINGNVGAPLQGQALVYIGDDAELFWEQFRNFGWIAIL
jgi:phage N-6-adenine-methyltransferase